MKESLSDKFGRCLTVAIVVVVLVGGLSFLWPTYRRSQALRARDNEMTAEIERKRAEIARLKECQRRFKTDPEFVEAIARKNNRVFPGEIVFIFEDK